MNATHAIVSSKEERSSLVKSIKKLPETETE